MYTFLLSIVALLLGYFLYSRLVERVVAPDASKPTPAVTHNDGMDYIPMPTWKVFMIQFLNIAGTGPIFGAIMGAKFGPSCYLWIVLGCIFAGAVHDYLSGMLSMRHDGAGLPVLIGEYLGRRTKAVMLVFTVLMLTLVGAVFVYSPAVILGGMTEGVTGNITSSTMFWVVVVFIYYVIATFLPIDKIIGKIYPVFAFALIFMAVALFVCLLVKWPSLPEIWQGIGNRAPSVGVKGQSIFPCLFITVACGAISGFHATQSPLMARCLKNEKLGRPVFYGSMITEGLVALVWATVASYFFFDGGAAEVGGDMTTAAPAVVTLVSKSWLGVFGGVLAILGVVAAPITSGDTSLRSARLIVADAFKLDQKPWRNRIVISLPIFIAAALLIWFNISDSQGFNVIWRYFGWANQTLAVFTLWALTSWLSRERKGVWYLLTLLPACFMTAVTLTFILTDKTGFRLPASLIPYLGTGLFLVSMLLFYVIRSRNRKRRQAQKTSEEA
ncbi:MAG: carbon starvation protein A [Bacteroidaceae bacterium]|nr:carbon starvation protein A [Bacteroidaceae bacterium]